LALPPIAEPRDRGSLQNGIIDEQTVDAGGSYGVDIDIHSVGSASASTGAARDGYSFDPRRGWQNDAKAAQLLQQRQNYREPSSVDIGSFVAKSSKSWQSAFVHGRSPRCSVASRKCSRRVVSPRNLEKPSTARRSVGREIGSASPAARCRVVVQIPEI
jgi:hypothetical protein